MIQVIFIHDVNLPPETHAPVLEAQSGMLPLLIGSMAKSARPAFRSRALRGGVSSPIDIAYHGLIWLTLKLDK